MPRSAAARRKPVIGHGSKSYTAVHSGQLASRRTVGRGQLVRDALFLGSTETELSMIKELEQARPEPLRRYDQIAMRGDDLLLQVKLIAPYLAGKTVAFVGDADGTSSLLGMLGTLGIPQPRRMLVLDFDNRVLRAARSMADRYGFADRLEVRPYNVFDPIPWDLTHYCDWFYTNPPYGASNDGESARLFVARGIELTRPQRGSGCLILPYDPMRRWTQTAMLSTQGFLHAAGWVVREAIAQLHHYHLDDDANLPSSMLLVDQVSSAQFSLAYGGRRVGFNEVPRFYGESVDPPFPRYIQADGTDDYNWVDFKE